MSLAELNEKWSHRVLNGYFKCKDELMEMFSKRYPWYTTFVVPSL